MEVRSWLYRIDSDPRAWTLRRCPASRIEGRSAGISARPWSLRAVVQHGFAGLLAAAACAAIYFQTKVEFWAALAYAGSWLNLINLVPVLGLDGAQATHALDRTQRGLILAAAILFFAFLHEGVFLFIAAGMAWRLFRGATPENPSSATMIRYTLLLFLLGALMGIVPETASQF
jgi:Zn-dependent protease